MSRKNQGQGWPWWIDRRVVLDAWQDTHRRTIVLYGLKPPLDREGYVAVQARPSGEGPRVVLLLRDGDTLASAPEGDEERLLRRKLSGGPARPGGSRASRRAAALLSALAILVGACGTPVTEGPPLTAPQGDPGAPPEDKGPSPSPSPKDAAARFASAEDCPVIAPRELPSGADPGQRQSPPEDHLRHYMEVWGNGDDRVMVGRGRELFTSDPPQAHAQNFMPDDFPDYQQVEKDGVVRHVLPVGDPPLGFIQVRFVQGDCPYILWIESGHTLEEAMDYATRF